MAIIGIDLGTTNSVVSVMERTGPTVITNEEGTRTTPSVVAFTKDGDRLVGQAARRQAITNPAHTIFSVKRFMGLKHSDAKKELARMPYDVVKGKDGLCRIKIERESYAPPEISAQILSKLKRSAEDYLGQKVTEAVVTVPAYFNDAQRQATKDAGKIAGLEIKRIINEPTAAALAYGLDQNKEQTVVVYDFGGGTFDVSVLELGDNVIEVLATNGDTHLGGDDFDEVIIQWLLAEFKETTGMDVSDDKMVLQRLKESAEKAKIELSTAQQTEINLPFLTADATGPKHLQTTLSRSQYEKMIDAIVKDTLKPVRRALKDAGKKASDIDEVVLVGGTTRTPAIRNLVEKFFDQESNKSVNPDEVVALGAAVQGGVFSGDVTDILLLDVTPLSLGIETLGSIMTRLIERNTTIPCEKSEVFSTAGDNQSAVDIHVLQGEREMADGNRTLGRFQLSGIPPAPRGVPQIEVKFEIDADGIVHVSAGDKATGKEQSIKIESGSALSEEEIETMISDAEKFRAEDQERREIIEQTNKLDSLLHQTESMVKDAGDKISDEDTVSLEEFISLGRTALESNDPAVITEAQENLSAEVSRVASLLYTQQADDATTTTVAEEDIIEAEFDEKEMNT